MTETATQARPPEAPSHDHERREALPSRASLASTTDVARLAALLEGEPSRGARGEPADEATSPDGEAEAAR